jgi:flagellin
MDITALSSYTLDTISTTSATSNSGVISLQSLTPVEDINKNPSSAFSIADSLRRQASTLPTTFTNASNGVAFTQVTNLALSKQDEILDIIKNKLLYVKKDTTTNGEKEVIREDIVALLNKFDNIASDSNYQKLYYLQESNSSMNASLVYDFQISEIPSITLSTDSIQSNTQGLGLTTLKGLSANELTNIVASTQSGIVDDAITSIEEFQATYDILQNQFKFMVDSLDLSYSNLKTYENELRNIDYANESATFDKSKILSQFGSLATSQANTNQNRVSSLLTSNISFGNISTSSNI